MVEFIRSMLLEMEKKTQLLEMEMEMQGKKGRGRGLILFPAPFQGHLNPMLQLATILHTKGFNITVIHTVSNFNSLDPSKYPHFTFRSISESPSPSTSTTGESNFILDTLNESYVEPFRLCLAELLLNTGCGSVACLIADSLWYFSQDVAQNHKLPRIAVLTSGPYSILAQAALPCLLQNGCFHKESEAPVLEFPPLKVKDFPSLETLTEGLCNFEHRYVNGNKTASAIIWNTFEELEQASLETVRHNYPHPNFLIGPFHKYFPMSLEAHQEQQERESFMSWLDVQAPKSVIYVSFGSVKQMNEPDVKEIAKGLAYSMHPFLWVVRSGSVNSSSSTSEWLEMLPDGFLEDVSGRGKGHIIKWAPQIEVLAHPAIGCYWTHCGWNSTLESICEGVPMICWPGLADQPMNSRQVSDVWKIGVYLENGLTSEEIERAIKTVMVDEEGKVMRENINSLKEKANVCLQKGGSSYQSLEKLIDFILSF